jgi:hypothetical protein
MLLHVIQPPLRVHVAHHHGPQRESQGLRQAVRNARFLVDDIYDGHVGQRPHVVRLSAGGRVEGLRSRYTTVPSSATAVTVALNRASRASS